MGSRPRSYRPPVSRRPRRRLVFSMPVFGFATLSLPPALPIDFQPSSFQRLTNPFFRKPFVFSSIRNARGWGHRLRFLQTSLFITSQESQVTSFQESAHSLSQGLVVCPFFSTACGLFVQIPGGGTLFFHSPHRKSSFLGAFLPATRPSSLSFQAGWRTERKCRKRVKKRLAVAMSRAICARSFSGLSNLVSARRRSQKRTSMRSG